MNELEQKRKELQDKANGTHGGRRTKNIIRLEGFDIGVEMARKEFFKKIDKLIDKLNKTTGVSGDVDYGNLSEWLDEIKKSLEVKK